MAVVAGFSRMRGGITPFLRTLLLAATMALVAISGASILGDVGTDTDNDGIPDAVEITEGTNPAVKDNDIFASKRLLVMQVYRDFLGREADAGGLAFWQGRLDAGTLAPEGFIDLVQGQAEFQARVAPVIRLYLTALNRRPDHGGLTFWARQFATGTSLEAIATAFAGSPEFNATYGALTNRQYIELLYLNTLNRPGDVRGVDFWTSQLDNGLQTRGQMLVTFSESPENVGVSTAEVLVAMAYAGMLNRTADVAGFNFWVDRVTLAFDRIGLIRAFFLSQEFHNRFLPAPTPPAITSANATTFYVGAPGTFTVTGTGVPAPTFGQAGALPAGVSFNSATGVLSGTPAAGTAGTYALTFTAANGNPPDATQNFVLTVSPAVAITSAAATTFTVGTAGTFTVTTASTPVAVTITQTGALPAGVTFVNNGNGTATLAGTPAAGTGGTYPITITAANGVAANGTQNFVLTVNQAPAITSAAAATFLIGVAGTHTVTATGFPAPTVAVTAGALPGGVTLSAAGVLAGTPTATGTFNVTITASNGVSPSATQSFTLTVNAPPAITSANAATFQVGQLGSFTPVATGVPAPTIGMTGTPPGGVNFAGGVLSGTPGAGTGGTYNLTFTASNGVGSNAVQSFTLTVNDVPAIASANNTTFQVGVAGTFNVAATGFPAPTFAVTTGSLPSGVTLSAAGLLSGTPTATGTFNLTITASNGVAPDATQNFTLTVNDPANAVDDAFTTVHDTVLDVTAPGYRANDTGMPVPSPTSVSAGGPLCSFPCILPMAHGTATFASNDGSFIYTPAPGFAGTDTFTYTTANASGTDTATVTIMVTNVAPVVDLDGAATGGIDFGPVAFIEDAGPVAIVGTVNPNWLTITDADGPTIASATVVLTNLQDVGAETLAVTCPSGPAPACSGAIQTTDIVATPAPGSYTIVITRASSFADYEALLRSLTYANASQNPTILPNRDITVTVNDGISPSSPVAHATVALTAANDAPVLAAIEAGALAYSIGSPAVAVTSTTTGADVDSANLAGATVQVTANCVNADDVLVFAPQNGISGNYVPATCTMTLTGSATVANYQAAMRDVRFQNTNAATSLLIRTVSFQANDGGVVNNLSNTVTRDVTLATNGSPVLTAGATLNYTESQAPTAIDTTVTVTDADSVSLIGATIQITGNCLSIEDVLSFTTQFGINGVYAAGTCTMTLSGIASLANYQTALRSVQYSNTSGAPSTLARTVTWQVNDGGAINNLSNTPTSTINVAAVNSAPVVTAGGTLNYTENQAATAIDTTVTVTDADSVNLTVATVQITANCNNPQDVLGFTTQNGISGVYTPVTCLMTLSGSSSVANYQAALRGVTYFNSSENPATAARTVTWIVNDGALPSASASSTINVTAVNDAPVLAAIEVAALGYTENGPAAAITSTLTIADADSTNMAGATVAITANCTSPQDVLAFTNQNGITGSYNGGTCTMTLTGSSSMANYQTALRSITYANTSDNPSALTRTVSFTVNDGGAVNNLSNTVTRNITVTAVNDPPVATAFSNLPAQAGIPITYSAGKLTGADPEGTTVTIDTTPINVTNGTVTINANGGFTFTPSPLAATASFQYRVTDSGSPAPPQNSAYVTVSFTVTGPAIFFVKNPAVGLANCTLGNECLFATAIAGIGGTTGATIFIADANSHTAGSVLNANGRVIGQGITGTTFDTFFSIGTPAEGALAARPLVAQARPIVTAGAGTTLTLNSTNTLRGFDLGNTSPAGTGISGTGFGTLTASDMSVGTTGSALSLSIGTAAVTFDAVSSSGGASNVNLNTLAGSLTINGGTLTNATATAFNVNTGTASITYAGTIASGTGPSVTVANKTAGTVTFSGAVTDTDTGISLTSNTGATIAFTGGLNLSTTTNTAFLASGGGTVNVSAAAVNTVSTISGTGVSLTGVGGSITFRSVNVSSGGANGVFLQNTTGSFTVTGISGGNCGGLVVDKNTLPTAPVLADCTGGTITNAATGIRLDNVQNVSLTRMHITGTVADNFGIYGTSVNGFTLAHSVIDGSIGASTAGQDAPLVFGVIDATNGFSGGTNSITDSTIQGGIEHNMEFYNTSGTFGLTIARTVVKSNSVAGGADGIQMEMRGTADATVLLDNNYFDDNKSQAIQVAANVNSVVDVTIRNSKWTRTTQGNEGVLLSNGTNGVLTADIDNNIATGFGGTAIFVGQTPGNASATSQLHARIRNNNVTAPITATNHAIIAFPTSTAGIAAPARIQIDGNTVVQNSTGGTSRAILVDTPDAGTNPNFHATVTGNNASVTDNVAGVGALVVQSRQNATACMAISGNTATVATIGVNAIRARQVAPATANLFGAGANSAAVLGANNPGSTTEVLGTIGLTGVPCPLPNAPALP